MLTVCIPTYHSEPWLQDAIGSIDIDCQIVVVHDDGGRGAGWARNCCLAKATGDYIFMLDADNLLTPGCLAALLEHARPDRVVSPGAVQFFGASGWAHRWTFANVVDVETILMAAQSPAATAQVMFHRSLPERFGGWPEDCGAFESWAFYSRCALRGYRFVTVPDTYYMHRLHGDSYWWRRADNRADDLEHALAYLPGVDAEAIRRALLV